MMTTTTEAVTALQIFKNVILEGPPGTGKTFSVESIADEWPGLLFTDATDERADGKGFWCVTFHPSTSYEEFVEGIRYNPSRADPNDDSSPRIGFELRPGIFREWVDTARAEPQRDFLVLIDEINRANVSKVLGDLLLGLEASKRLTHDPTCTRTDGQHEECWSGTTTQLPYSNKLLGVPDNLYVLGTMNSSDRSIAPLDSALRRRFAFVRVPPLAGDELKTRLTTALPEVGAAVIERSVNALDRLNAALGRALGVNSMLGHSYLFELAPAAGAEGLWMEVDSSAVGAGTQLQTFKEWANRLLSAVGSTTQLSASGGSELLTVHYDGQAYPKIRLEHTSGNYRFSGPGIPFNSMTNGVTIWRPIGAKEVALEYVPAPKSTKAARTAMVDGFDAKSEPISRRAGSRRCGRLLSDADVSADARERAIWTYAILPQLLETVTQAFSLDLLTTGSRQTWLGTNLTPAVAEQVGQELEGFDSFLHGHLGLQITLAGQGLSSGLVVEEYQEAPAPESLSAEDA